MVNWGVLIGIFFLATFKFMFSAIPGSIADVPAWQTFVACTLGGTFSAALFYFSAELLIKFSHKRRVKKVLSAEAKGIVLPHPKKFTRMNKFIIRVKHLFGIYGIALWAPFFLSVPIGTIITAKFYGKKKITFLLITLGMFINGAIITVLSYMFK